MTATATIPSLTTAAHIARGYVTRPVVTPQPEPANRYPYRGRR